MKINGMQVAPVEDKKPRGKSKAAGAGIPQPVADESEQSHKKSSILVVVIILLVVALILAGLVFFAFKMRPSGKVPMSATTSQTAKSKGKNEPSGADAVSGGVFSNAVSVQGVSVKDDSLGYNISVVSYIPGYKASDGSTVMLVKYKAKPIGSVYSLVDTSALKLKINDKVISFSSDYNTDMSKLNLDVFESTEASQEVSGWLAYPYNGDPTGIAFYYDRGTVGIDSTFDSAGAVEPEMKKEIPLSSGK